ncbi:bifunctional DNA-formamidopyrimidine glycosylase/DNA-(apurinic or apyrimidinic site) lyase [Georgenia sp. 10Sc9-8]|uniref:Formamidopyrimidine-DNA glycosylase n=1 Tax=Georgenia halotolerans TaxID=3028317 RepID=A0ABT5U0V7_9MICO|nr:bifunctional DNA-formamidopyrimidine glycosylase/DNA-(apurinic or apyrimidinic site) lyase [Georgenia halotolerans]
MPELPEVETVRAGLARHVLHRRIADVRVLHPRAVRRQSGGAEELTGRLRGRSFTAAVRRGKYLWLVLDDDTEGLLAHLGMSGQLLVHAGAGAPPPVPPEPLPPAVVPGPLEATPTPGLGQGRPPVDLTATRPASTVRAIPTSTAHLRLRVRFTDDGELWFVDQRTFGHLMVTDLTPTADDGPGGHGSDLAALPSPVVHIARDLLDPHLDRRLLLGRIRARRTEVKRALLDQALVSGVGNIYADEALWRAQVHGARTTDRLRPVQLNRLLDHAAEVMRDALRAGGTSFDALYVDVDGASGYFARSLAVYGRAGHPCPRCGTVVQRTQFMNRSSFFCPSCQVVPRPRR